MQRFAILYPVGESRNHLAYRVCYSDGPERLRITTITADHSRTRGHRILRKDDPKTWGLVRQALIERKTIVFFQ